MAHSLKQIRTLALVGQAGAGKTSLAEALLAKAGAIAAPGTIERGSTVCDYTPLEKQLQHSLKLAVASFEHQQTKIHLLDTPGYPDFLGHSLSTTNDLNTISLLLFQLPLAELETKLNADTLSQQDVYVVPPPSWPAP